MFSFLTRSKKRCTDSAFNLDVTDERSKSKVSQDSKQQNDNHYSVPFKSHNETLLVENDLYASSEYRKNNGPTSPHANNHHIKSDIYAVPVKDVNETVMVENDLYSDGGVNNNTHDYETEIIENELYSA